MTTDIKGVLDHMSPRDIWRNMDGILESGVSIDYLLDLGEPEPEFFVSHYKLLLDLGANPQKLFNKNEEWYITNANHPQDLAEVFGNFIQHGLSYGYIERWTKLHLKATAI